MEFLCCLCFCRELLDLQNTDQYPVHLFYTHSRTHKTCAQATLTNEHCSRKLQTHDFSLSLTHWHQQFPRFIVMDFRCWKRPSYNVRICSYKFWYQFHGKIARTHLASTTAKRLSNSRLASQWTLCAIPARLAAKGTLLPTGHGRANGDCVRTEQCTKV